jgi:polar amino acid transport system substrate-binding protein
MSEDHSRDSEAEGVPKSEGVARRGLIRAGGLGGAALLAAATRATPAAATMAAQPPVSAAYADFVLPNINSDDDSLTKIIKKGSLVAGMSQDWPYSFLDDKTGEWKGLDADIVRMAAKMLQIPKIDVQTVTFDGLVPGTISGRFDMIADSIHYTKARAKVVGFSFPTYYYAETLVVAKGNPQKIHQLPDLKGKRVGTLVGTNYMEWMGELGIATAQPYKDWVQMLPELANGRLDAVLYDQPVMAATINQHPEWKVEMVEEYEPRTFKNPNGYSRYVFRQSDIALTNAFSAAIEWMQYNGELKKILTNWGLTGYNN